MQLIAFLTAFKSRDHKKNNLVSVSNDSIDPNSLVQSRQNDVGRTQESKYYILKLRQKLETAAWLEWKNEAFVKKKSGNSYVLRKFVQNQGTTTPIKNLQSLS